jgi:hypothetical protein
MKGRLYVFRYINTSSFSKFQYLSSYYKKIGYSVLKGMFERGVTQNVHSNDNDEFVDAIAAILIKVHKDKTILPIIVDMIFFRNRKGIFTHDLIWAFFQAREPKSLMLIANYLSSKDVNDVKLACKLLDFVPSIDMTMGRNSKDKYVAFFNWLNENYPFLYFTGESFQRTSNPKPFIVDLDAKYMCRRLSLYTGKPLIRYTEKEKNLLGYFNMLDHDNKLLLSTCSFKIYYENIYLWTSWINHSIIKQISIAESRFRA